MAANAQQMSDAEEKSDDLIAELAKLMSSGTTASKPTIKLTPLSEAASSPTGPIRIPGMDAPRSPVAAAPQPQAPIPARPASPQPVPQAATPAAPMAIRLPGMAAPVPVNPSPATPAQARPASSVLPDTRPQAPRQFDFGKPAAAAPILNSEPVGTPQAPKVSPVSRSIDDVSPPVAQRQEPAIAAEAPKAPEPQSSPIILPASQPTAAKPAAAPETDGFDFDFGFGDTGPESDDGKSGGDPIADLILADLDGAEAPQPAAKSAAPASSLTVVPTRTAAPQTAQAPILVAKSTGNTVSARQPSTPIPLKPVSTPTRQVQSPQPDAFAVSPAPAQEAARASGQRAAAPIPSVDSDPMDEIESLIGEAVRVELNAADKSHATQKPQLAVPVVPVAPTFKPSRANLREADPSTTSAEAAILAAAAATGAEVGRVEPSVAEDTPKPAKRMKVKPPRTKSRMGAGGYVGMAVAGTLLLASGFGVYWIMGMGGPGTGNTVAPVLTADASPVKVNPVVTPGTTANASRSVVLDGLNGDTATASTETLVSRDETEGADVTEVARVVTPEAEDTEGGLANRKVRTVTVRPDGTIVSGDEAVAGNETLPVAKPNVPDLPGAEPDPIVVASTPATTETPTTPAAVTAILSEAAPGATPEEPVSRDLTALVDPAEPTNTTPAVFDASLVAPIPMPRPADRSQLNGNRSASVEAQPVDLIASEPETPVAAAPARETVRAAAFVQVASMPSEADANAQVRSQTSKFGGLFNGNQLVVQRVDLGEKGIRYRVRLPAGSLQEANRVCASIKANGGDCFATNG